MDLLEIRRKAKEQKKSAPRVPAAKAAAAEPVAAPPSAPPLAQVPTPETRPVPVAVAPAPPRVEAAPMPAKARPGNPAKAAAAPMKFDVGEPTPRAAAAETTGIVLEDSFLEAGFFQLATEELYRHTYDVDQPEATSHQVLACLLADERYGIDIHSIKEIIKTREITEVPRAPHFILGIITLRGTVIPIFDLRERLGLTGGPLTRDSKIVVVTLKGALYGMVVDAVIDVAGIPETSLESAPTVMVGVEGRFISGIGRAEGEMIILLNLTEVLHIEAQP